MSSGEFVSESKPPLTRGKLILIGTLASTLGGILWTQFSGEDTESKVPRKGGKAAQAPANPAGATVAAVNLTAPTAADPTKKDTRSFPEVSHDEMLQHDPFALSEAFVRKQVAAATSEANEGAEALRKQEEQKKHQSLRQQALEQAPRARSRRGRSRRQWSSRHDRYTSGS